MASQTKHEQTPKRNAVTIEKLALEYAMLEGELSFAEQAIVKMEVELAALRRDQEKIIKEMGANLKRYSSVLKANRASSTL